MASVSGQERLCSKVRILILAGADGLMDITVYPTEPGGEPITAEGLAQILEAGAAMIRSGATITGPPEGDNPCP